MCMPQWWIVHVFVKEQTQVPMVFELVKRYMILQLVPRVNCNRIATSDFVDYFFLEKRKLFGKFLDNVYMGVVCILVTAYHFIQLRIRWMTL